MAEFPALPLWTDAYLGDTTHLTTFEHGAYLLLLMVSWRSPGCCLPDDDALLARYTRMTLDKWRKARPVLAPFFRVGGGLWHQARLQDEFRHVQSRREQQSEAGRSSVKAKSLKRQNRGSTVVGDPLQRKPNGASTPISTPITVAKATDAAASELDPVKILFDLGIAVLTAAGSTDKQARSMVGQWRKSHGDAWTLQALLDAKAKNISEPIAWISARPGAGVVDIATERARLRRLTIERYQRDDAERAAAAAAQRTEH